MQKYPYVKQDGYKDCGAASLLMIIRYYHGNLPIDDVRALTKTTKEGCTAFHLVQAALKIGFEASGVKCEFSDITKDNIILPCIANIVIHKSYYHFVVLYEINFKKKYVMIGDPADGIKKVNFNIFISMFNNVLIILFPKRQLPIIRDQSSISFIFDILTKYRSLLKNIIILSIFITILSIVSSFYTQFMFDSIDNYSKRYLVFIFIIFFSVYILKIISNYFRNKLLIMLNQKIDLHLTLGTFSSVVNLPYSYYHTHTIGEIMSKITDLGLVRDVISKVALTMFIDLPLTLVSFVCLYFIHSKLFVISIFIMTVYLMILLVFHKPLGNRVKEAQRLREQTNSIMIESISGFETIQGISIHEKVLKRSEKKYVKFLKKLFELQNIYYLENTLKELLNDLGFLIIILIGFFLVIDQEISLGSLLTFQALLVYFFDPIKNILDLDFNIKEADGALKRVMSILIHNEDTGSIMKFSHYDIQFCNLSYTYNDKVQILDHINFTIEEGSKVMLAGVSGGGKSTLMKLLLKYYPVDMNQIQIGGIDLNHYKMDTIRKNIKYISQKEILFTDSLENNIKIDRRVDDSKFLKVNMICEINDILNRNHLGYEMLIEENGFNLSGGEKQRIVLARTLLLPFKILIIDEGLEQVDVNQERRILKKMFYEYPTKTIIFITHRTNNVDLFDSMITMQNGKIESEISKNVSY